MTFSETEYDLEAELATVTDKLEENLDETAQMDVDHPQYSVKVQEGEQLEKAKRGLEWATSDPAADERFPQWDENVDTITLAGLSGGEIDTVQGGILDDDEDRSLQEIARTHQVRAGTVDAPFVGDDMGKDTELYAVYNLPDEILTWAEWRIDDLSTLGEGKGNGYAKSLAARRAELNSQS